MGPNGKALFFHGINWFGFDDGNTMVDGLWEGAAFVLLYSFLMGHGVLGGLLGHHRSTLRLSAWRVATAARAVCSHLCEAGLQVLPADLSHAA